MRSSSPLAGPTIALALAITAAGCLTTAAHGQATRVKPRDSYLLVFAQFFDGEFRSAGKNFHREARAGVRSSEGRWVDSICYYTMMGECSYQLGDLSGALSNYEAALNIFLQNKSWLLRIRFPEQITSSNSNIRSRIPWGVTSRRTTIANLPGTMLSFQGQLDNQDVIRRGGVVNPAQYYPLRVQEIVRCTAVALRRRLEILGPICKHDPLTESLLKAFSEPLSPRNHWSQAWINVHLGLAYASADRPAEAVKYLQSGVALLGRFDHQLTPIALLELGKLAIKQGEYDVASNYLLEASLAAAQFAQADVIEEALRYGLRAHLMSGKRGLYPPLPRAIAWASRERIDFLEASLLVLASQNASVMGNAAQASSYLNQARKLMLRSEMRTGRVGVRFEYQAALADYQQGNVKGGDATFASAMSMMSKMSRRLFQISMANGLYVKGNAAITPRIADLLYSELLREPTATEWAAEPMETLAVLKTPHLGPLENWFELALKRKEQEKAVEIAEQIRRHRFYSALPMGGRLLALRWVLEGSEDTLSKDALLQRKDLLVKFPGYAALAKQESALRQELDALPPVVDVKSDKPAAVKQAKLLKNLAQIGDAKETLLRQIALQREPSEFVFPGGLDLKEMRRSMPEDQIVASYLITSRSAYGFLFTRSQFAVWVVDQPADVRKNISTLLSELGNFSTNHALTKEQLGSAAWREPAAALTKQLLRATKADTWAGYDEIVIVPDGPLWYVPFEALQTSRGEMTVPLMMVTRLRYVPFVSMALPDQRPRRPSPRTAVTVGKLSPREEVDPAEETFAALRKEFPKAFRLPSHLPSSSAVVSTLWDQLVVLDDMESASRGAYDWSPAQIDRGKYGSDLEDWFHLPFGGPDQMILPGFHTQAETALRHGGTGHEIFLAAAGMMSQGTRTILLSRWRPGGQTAHHPVREFTLELPRATAANAWQRSVELLWQEVLDPEREPRVKLSRTEQPPRAKHPFFWSGYMVIDTGSEPRK